MALTRHDDDQRCSHVDRVTGEQCITILCQYDEGPECFAHSPQTRIATRRQDETLAEARQRRAFEELQRMMGQYDQRIAA